jgi:hypothetical protein
VKGILAQLAKTIGQELIAIGTPLLINPATAAQGAAYIAAGTALTAIGAKIASGGGGGGSSSASGGGQSIQGGGEGRADVPGTGDAPSFKTGVDGFGGGLAQVHKDELIALPPASNVITNENAQALRGAMGVMGQRGGAAGGGGGSQDVNVNAQVEGRIGVDDPFRFVEMVERTQQDREDLVGGR